MRSLSQRVWVAFAATVVGAVSGAFGGYLLGRATLLGQTQARLVQYANRIMAEGNTATAESRKILKAMNTSPFPFCSEEEVAYFRRLVFQSQFLKEGGRMRDGQVQCSTTLGRSAPPQQRYVPDFAQDDGTLLYRDLPLFRIGNKPVLAVQSGRAYIVYSPYTSRSQIAAPMHYTVTDRDARTHLTGLLTGDTPRAPQEVLVTEGISHLNGTIYETQCAGNPSVCLTTYVSVHDALLANRMTLVISGLLGALAGALLGFLCWLMYERNRGMEHRLLRAIRRDKLRVVYQPIVDLGAGEIVEAEALVRWTDEDNLAISPDVFIKVAEEAGYVGEITRLVVRNVLNDFQETLRERPTFRVNVNIAAPDLADPGFMPMLERALAEAGVQPASLGIEITESYTARQQIAKETILRLRQKGHFVHIDDFGTGYSSLAYLHDLSVDAIKIDKAFTKAIGTDAVTVSILPQILTMADTLDLRVVVEGVETQQQAAYFAAADQSIYAQGWLFGHPVPAQSFHRLLGKTGTENGSGLSPSQTGVVAPALPR
jgi:sensor c-di-GMP phosphodiesterase-like protein